MIGQEILELQSNTLNESRPYRELAYAKVVAIELINTDTPDFVGKIGLHLGTSKYSKVAT